MITVGVFGVLIKLHAKSLASYFGTNDCCEQENIAKIEGLPAEKMTKPHNHVMST